MDRIGVPHESKWRSAILFMRSISDYSVYNNHQKMQIQNLVIEVLREKRFSESDFYSLERNMNEILSESWKNDLHDELRAISTLIKNTRSLMLKRKREMKSLETATMNILATESPLEKAIRSIRLGFQEMIELMEEDASNLVRQSLIDPLTALDNRRSLELLLGDVDEGAFSNNLALTLLMIDVDNFKMFNSAHGHPVGDHALTTLASEFRGMRQGGPGETPWVTPFRYGGGTFSIVALGMGPQQGQDLAETIRSRVEALDFQILDADGTVSGTGSAMTVSIGGACRLRLHENAAGWKLLRIADECLYVAKTTGRNQVVFTCPD